MKYSIKSLGQFTCHYRNDLLADLPTQEAARRCAPYSLIGLDSIPRPAAAVRAILAAQDANSFNEIYIAVTHLQSQTELALAMHQSLNPIPETPLERVFVPNLTELVRLLGDLNGTMSILYRDFFRPDADTSGLDPALTLFAIAKLVADLDEPIGKIAPSDSDVENYRRILPSYAAIYYCIGLQLLPVIQQMVMSQVRQATKFLSTDTACSQPSTPPTKSVH